MMCFQKTIRVVRRGLRRLAALALLPAACSFDLAECLFGEIVASAEFVWMLVVAIAAVEWIGIYFLLLWLSGDESTLAAGVHVGAWMQRSTEPTETTGPPMSLSSASPLSVIERMMSPTTALVHIAEMEVAFCIPDIVQAMFREVYLLAYLSVALVTRCLLEVLLFPNFTLMALLCYIVAAACCQEQQSEISSAEAVLQIEDEQDT
jgi:hypothetical protein